MDSQDFLTPADLDELAVMVAAAIAPLLDSYVANEIALYDVRQRQTEKSE